MAIQIFVIFTPKLGEKIQFDHFFSSWVSEKPPTSNALKTVLEISFLDSYSSNGNKALEFGPEDLENVSNTTSTTRTTTAEVETVCGFPPLKTQVR